MAEPHVVAALKDKRAELSGSIADLEKRIGQHRADLLHADLLHVDAVLRLFAPELAPSTILPRAVRRPNSWFKPNDTATTEIYTLSLHDALRSRWSPYHSNKPPDRPGRCARGGYPSHRRRRRGSRRRATFPPARSSRSRRRRRRAGWTRFHRRRRDESCAARGSAASRRAAARRARAWPRPSLRP